jgi:hypothetical protein
MQLDRRLVGWGLIFILIGAIPLAVNAGLLDEDLVARWTELWPLLIIAVGVSLVLSRTGAAWVGSLVAGVVVGSMVGGFVATGFPAIANCGGGTAHAFQTQSGTLGTTARMNVEFDCGELAITTVDGSGWQLTGRDGDGQSPSVTTSADGVAIKPLARPWTLFSRGKVEWDLAVPRSPTLDFGLTLNAGSGVADLSGASIASFNVTVNAGSLDATLGSTSASNAVNMTVNAGSANLTTGATSGTFNLSMNAGSLNVCLPAGTMIRVSWQGTLASHDLDALGLVKLDNHTWTSSGFDAGQAHVELDVSANAGSFSLKLGGVCGA